MIARTTLTLVGFILLIAFYVGFFLGIINTQGDANNVFIVDPKDKQLDIAKVLDNRAENFFYFIQISDTHFNHYNDHNRSNDLMSFCKNILPIISPPVLVLTGDITDSRDDNPMGSRQYKQEWDTYNATRLSCLNDNHDLTWLDIRGNHDNFNVFGDTNAFYKNYTVQATMTKDAKSYRYQYNTTDGNTYSFIAVDACFHPGIRRPFNFIGRLDLDELKKIEQLKLQSEDSNYTIWFGHYPTSSITNSADLQKLINGPYLCGHYHNFHGLAPQMWSSQPEGYFEVELGDWKSNRFFRINVIDGGLYSFADFNYYPSKIDEPMIVITNPRSVLFQMEKYEKFWRTERSTHIRAAVFSASPLKRVYACISNKKNYANSGMNCLEKIDLFEIQAPLYGAKWSNEKYKAGLFYISVFAENQHKISMEIVPFSLDRTKPKYSVIGRFSIRASFEMFGLIIYLSTVLSIIGLLITIRFSTTFDRSNWMHYSNLARKNFIRKQFVKVYLVSHINSFFYPFVIIPTYMSIGPWMISRIVEHHIGVIFIWKQFVDGYLLPTAFSYLYAALYLWVFHIPTIFIVGSFIYRQIGERFRQISLSNDSSSSNVQVLQNKMQLFDYVIVFYSITLIILSFIYSSMYYFAYDVLAITTSLFTWASVINAVLIYLSWKIRKVKHID